jgi:Ca-activated chloride channel family protein
MAASAGLAACLLAPAIVAQPVDVSLTTPQEAAALVIRSPADDVMLVGPSELAAEVRPASQAVSAVEFFVDGVLACTIRERPFRCLWNAGQSLRPRTLRVVATLADGQRLTVTARTKGMVVNDAVSVDAVAISVRVTDRDGRFVSGLTRDDFQLFEDGVRQEIGGFAAEDAGAEVVVALDVSRSMQSVMGDLSLATRLFLDALRPQDEVTLATFSTGLIVVAPPSATGADRAAALDRLEAGGNTALYDAMVRASALFTAFGQRAVVMFTDGRDVVSRASAGSVRTALQSADVGLYVVGQGEAAQNGALRDLLTTLARETGGASFFSSRPADLRAHFAQIADDISHRYLITFTPARSLGDGAWRALEIRLTDPGLRHTVRSREGYLALRRRSGGIDDGGR